MHASLLGSAAAACFYTASTLERWMRARYGNLRWRKDAIRRHPTRPSPIVPMHNAGNLEYANSRAPEPPHRNVITTTNREAHTNNTIKLRATT